MEVNIGDTIKESGLNRKELFIIIIKYLLLLFVSPNDKLKKRLKLFLTSMTRFLQPLKNHSRHCS